MEFGVVGGDRRFAYLTKQLRDCGRDAWAIGGVEENGLSLPSADRAALTSAQRVVVNWPIPDGEMLLQGLSKGTKVFFCGPKGPQWVPEGVEAIDLWKDEKLLLENAWLTAEGAVSAAMQAMTASVRESRFLVIGWGRIGRALTEILIGMSAQVTVASRTEKGRHQAMERGADCVSTADLKQALRGKQVIFSTPPVPVLEQAALEQIEKNALIIDLASPPYGVNLKAAESLGLRAWREPGLPGRYCPESAGEALLRAILRSELNGRTV